MRRLACARMKIAMVTETYPPEVNGVARTVQEMVEGLRRRGHAIRLARPRQGDNDQPFLDGNLHEWLGRGIAIPRYPPLKMGLPAKGPLVRNRGHTGRALCLALRAGEELPARDPGLRSDADRAAGRTARAGRRRADDRGAAPAQRRLCHRRAARERRALGALRLGRYL